MNPSRPFTNGSPKHPRIARALWTIIAVLLAGPIIAADAPEDLERFQTLLKNQGFHYGAVDGVPGPETTAAIKRFQIQNGLPVTGDLDATTREAILRGSDSGSPGAPPPSARPTQIPLPSPPPLSQPARDRPTTGSGARQPPAAQSPSPAAPAARPSTPPRAPSAGDAPANPPAPEPTQPPSAVRAIPAPQGVPPIARLPGQARPSRPHPTGNTTPDHSLFTDGPFADAGDAVRGAVVIRVKVELSRRGLFWGTFDSRENPAVRTALTEFQEIEGLDPTGTLTEPTLDALGLGALIADDQDPSAVDRHVHRGILVAPPHPAPRPGGLPLRSW